MGQIGPDITFDELRRDHIESLRVIDDLRTRAESLEKALEEEKRHHAHDVEGLAQSCKGRLEAEKALEERDARLKLIAQQIMLRLEDHEMPILRGQAEYILGINEFAGRGLDGKGE